MNWVYSNKEVTEKYRLISAYEYDYHFMASIFTFKNNYLPFFYKGKKMKLDVAIFK